MSNDRPTLRRVLNSWTLNNLPASSAFPLGLEAADAVAFLRDAGYTGLQLEPGDALLQAGFDAGLHMSATGRVIAADAADTLVQEHRDLGFAETTLHVGTGFEGHDDAMRLMEAVIEASSKHDYPLSVETHRATLTQDPRRTIDFVNALPDLRINADMSHWYTGCELPYGDFEAKLDAMQPVFDRVRYMHGRIGDGGCIQVRVDDREAHNVQQFEAMWTKCFEGFLRHTDGGNSICFAPELLPWSTVVNGQSIYPYYARQIDGPEGAPTDESDRWQQGLLLCEIAETCFAAALANTGKIG